ncbi:ABC transporter permease [Polymorphobacter fuscus]|uniref:ABC transporter permease n=1 Tax=Sandarakinorhabdus fusca TaxID=1439888 RepID=UPI0016BAA7B4|nr:FtsX-like permease family protein [Polymorphobacter fuscus]NJC07667.1 putative ABC transport system permease protein [Polymorphobacter fuscus]
MNLPLRLALRELRGGLTGLRLLAVCLILGVAALAGVGSLASAINAGLAERGQLLLGGDVEARLSSRFASGDERARFDREGVVSNVVRLRAMAGTADGADRLLAEVKAVDARWPLYGNFRRVDGPSCRAGCIAPGTAVVAPALAERLGLKTGDTLMIGEARLRVAGVVAEEPDAAGEGFGFGPGVLMARDDVEATGLLQPGAQFRSLYRIKLPPRADAVAVAKRLEAEAPDAGFQFRDSSNGAPSTRRFVDRLGQFLTLVGLTALVVAGVGVAGGVSAYLGAKTRTIATLKTLGADTATIRAIYLWQIGLVALGAVAIGLAIGAATPWIVARLAAASLPVPPVLTPQWGALATAAAYGVLIALAFALWPLAQAARMPAARLFRSLTERRDRPTPGMIAAIVGAGLAIVGITVANATDRLFVLGFVGAALALIGLLWALAGLVRWTAARVPRPRGTLARLALGNLHRPGAPTRQLIVALGLGLTLFATLAVIETNFTGQISRTLPDKAPTFFVIDIPNDGRAGFEAMVAQQAPGAAMTVVPSLRGPVTAVNGVPASQIDAGPDAWILRGDRGLSYAADFPPNNELVSGTWWPRDYAGPPLISIDDDAARALGLKIGDSITVSVLGVELTAKIASTRKIDWQSLGFNFAILFAPGSLEAAPHGWMATLAVTPAQERGIQSALAAQFPTASVVRVKDVLGQVAELLGQLSAAIRAAAGVTVAAGIAVLIGALAAGARARTYDSVLLKLLGATRGQVARATLAEYGLLALVVSGLALLLGAGAGWYVITQVFKLEWQPEWGPVVATVLTGGLVTVLLGLAGSWRALSARPNAVLRDL